MSTDFVAPFVLSYTYKRSLGPVLSRFMTSLREGRIEGVRTAAGRVLMPPCEYDPETGEEVQDWVELGPMGRVNGWCWVSSPLPEHPLQEPFAWALIQLDGADTAFVHAVSGPEDQLQSGARVQPIWAEERVGSIRDIRCFEVVR
jgi:uncharacterized protein